MSICYSELNDSYTSSSMQQSSISIMHYPYSSLPFDLMTTDPKIMSTHEQKEIFNRLFAISKLFETILKKQVLYVEESAESIQYYRQLCDMNSSSLILFQSFNPDFYQKVGRFYLSLIDKYELDNINLRNNCISEFYLEIIHIYTDFFFISLTHRINRDSTYIYNEFILSNNIVLMNNMHCFIKELERHYKLLHLHFTTTVHYLSYTNNLQISTTIALQYARVRKIRTKISDLLEITRHNQNLFNQFHSILLYNQTIDMMFSTIQEISHSMINFISFAFSSSIVYNKDLQNILYPISSVYQHYLTILRKYIFWDLDNLHCNTIYI